MGVFAVLQTEAGKFAAPKVHKCHLNLWSLDGLLGRRVFFFDVGLVLEGVAPTSSQTAATELDLLLPFEIDPEIPPIDLSRRLEIQDIANLVFGRSVRINAAAGKTQLAYEDSSRNPIQTTLLSIDPGRCKSAPSSDGSSLTKIVFSEPLEPGRCGYMRVRLELSSQRRTWINRRTLGVHHGISFDFRVLDPRGVRDPEECKRIENRALPLAEVDLFLILPAMWQAKLTYPLPSYLRALETYSWQAYLNRKPGLSRSQRFVILKFAATDVSAASPFAVYCDFNKDQRLQSQVVWQLAVLILIAIGILVVGTFNWTAISSKILLLWNFSTAHWLALTGSAVGLGSLYKFVKPVIEAVPALGKLYKYSSKQFRRFERWYFSAFIE